MPVLATRGYAAIIRETVPEPVTLNFPEDGSYTENALSSKFVHVYRRSFRTAVWWTYAKNGRFTATRLYGLRFFVYRPFTLFSASLMVFDRTNENSTGFLISPATILRNSERLIF
jgi:hypothetical protein